MSLIFATQLAAVATLALAVGAIVTGVLAYLAFRKQSQEVGILQLQMQEESLRRRSQQASRVIFSDMPTVTDSDKGRTFRFQTEITNHSDLPIYAVTLLWDVEKLSELRGVENALGTAPTLLPGASIVRDKTYQLTWLPRQCAVFSDASGIRWKRKANGTLIELRELAKVPDWILPPPPQDDGTFC